MRIAIYHNLHSGGGKRALYEMTRRLADEHQVDVYTLSCAEHDFCDLRPYCNEHIVFPFNPLPLVRRPFGRINQGIRALDLLRLRALQRRIADQIDATGYDVVFVHHCRYGQAPSLLQFLATPSVYYCQEPPRLIYELPVPRPYAQFSALQRLGNCFDPLPTLYHALLAKLDRISVQAASIVLVNSAYSRESLYRTYGIFARVCYLGVDIERFRPLGLPKEDFVLSVGHLNPHKGYDFLVQSLAKIDKAQRPPLIIVSDFVDSNEHRYLEELALRLGISVSFQTLISDHELVRLYNQARLTLYAPIMEPFGFVPIESMACGTPVIGAREGGVRETVVHEETGLLIERDLPAFAGAIESLLNDPQLCEYYGRQGRVVVEKKWQWDSCVHNLESHFTQLEPTRPFVSLDPA